MVLVDVEQFGLCANEFCSDARWFRCRTLDAMQAKTHCDHWYEDQGCCACGTDQPNLVVIEEGSTKRLPQKYPTSQS